ncbi:LuxR C-terminal-related transcriptional regulator [Nocardia sp. CA2R105]|uniref:ATP-binding protein n=1 Tax=Nocardia coffeae TaxID=2873381 RepID=UPI001CA6EA58|nr:LuxR C-terminal-related transcriptional regulator [Nocardia coffeae]MBY8857234.1 LuxR C-terminal-related transcriptional regulator [Nocardia coffeae]
MNVDEWSEIRRCHGDGESIKGIALRLGMSRNTVRRALSLDSPPEDHRRRSGSVTDDVEAQLRELIVADPEISIAELSRRVHWQRSRTLLARKVKQIRGELEAARQSSHRVAAGVPAPATTFVGRRVELRELRRLLGEHRLVSVVGPGGIGKTRLSIQAAYEFRRAFPDGVRFVDFTAVRTPGMLAQVVCDGLALENRDAHDRLPEETLVEYLRNRRMLLVLDNCEHVIDAAARLVTRLLESTSVLRVVTTTREYLSIPGEYVFNLSPLPTRGQTGGAVELFTARAAAVLSGFEVRDGDIATIERICDRLDGLPLAIELACARLTVFSIDDLSELLDHRVSVLAVGSRTRSPRHRSLHATMDWSYELCTPQERRLWARLSVFTDGFDLSMAVQVCADEELPTEVIIDSIAALVAKSVVRREECDRHVRFQMLESVREYGQDRLTPQERNELNARLLRWCVSAIRATTSGWYSADQVRHVMAIDRNRGNIRAALEAVISDPHDHSAVQDVAEALGSAMFLWACGISVREHRMWLTRIIDLPAVRVATKGHLLAVLALVQVLQGDRESARYSLHRARSIATAESDDALTTLLTHLDGLRALFAGDFDTARASMAQAASGYIRHGSPDDRIAMLRIHQGMLFSATAEIDEARTLFRTVHEDTAAVGEQWFHSYATYGLGLVALREGDFAQARAFALSGIRIQQQFGDAVGTTLLTELLGWSLAELGSAAHAAVLLGAASSMWGAIGQQLYGSEGWIALREKAIHTARTHCERRTFDRNWEKGQSMSMSDLLDFVSAESSSESSARPDQPRSEQRLRTAHAQDELLSPREREVAEWLAQGMTNKQIAEKLVLSTRTVEGHVEHVLRKLGLERRGELTAHGIDRL